MSFLQERWRDRPNSLWAESWWRGEAETHQGWGRTLEKESFLSLTSMGNSCRKHEREPQQSKLDGVRIGKRDRLTNPNGGAWNVTMSRLRGSCVQAGDESK